MKKLILSLATLGILVNSALGSEFTLKFSDVVAVDTPKGQAAVYFKKRLEALSKGRIEVDVYPSSQLYKDNAVLKAVAMDSVQMAAPAFSVFSKIVPQLALFNLPFLFKSPEQLHRVQDGPIGEKLKKMITDKGFIALGYWDMGFKDFLTNKKPFIVPSDAKGQKIRIMASKVLEKQFEAVGANPQVMPFSELYSALQQGVVDGCEEPITNIYTKKFYEVQKYITLSNHGYLGDAVVLSKTFWNSLPKDLQADVKLAFKETTVKERIWMQTFVKKQYKILEAMSKKTGKFKFYTLTSAQREQWRVAMKKIYPDFYAKDKIGKDLIEAAINTK